eukprot:tig00000441_g712.t1
MLAAAAAARVDVLRLRRGPAAESWRGETPAGPPGHGQLQSAVFEKLEARQAVQGLAPDPTALVFDTTVHQLHWLRFPDAAVLAGTGVLLTANKLGPPSIAVQSCEWTVFLVVGADGTVGPFSFSEAAQGSEQAVELLARRADTGAPLTSARIVFLARREPDDARAEPPPAESQASPAGPSPPGALPSGAPPPSLPCPPSVAETASTSHPPPPLQPAVAAPARAVAAWPQPGPSSGAQGEEDPAAPLEHAARLAERRTRATAHEQSGFPFLDPAVVSGLESLVISAREGEAAGSAAAGEGSGRRGGDADDAPAPPPPPPPAGPAGGSRPGRGSGGRSERDFVFESDAARAAFEERAGAALRALAAAPSPDTAAAFLRAFASGPALDSRFVWTPSGQRDLRRAALLLRAAARSVAPEQSALGGLVSSAVNGIMFFSRFAPEKLVAACERSWELADAVTPPTTGLALDLALVPVPQLVQLARLAAAFLEPLSEESPGPYAEALSFLGLRLLQNLEDEEACRVLYSAWGLVKRRGLSPCRAECRAIRCIAMSLARRNQNEKAAEVAACCYWFEHEGRLSGADWRIKFGSIDSLARVALGRRDWEVVLALHRTQGELAERQMDPEDPDVANLAFMQTAYSGALALHRGRYLEFIGNYRRTLRVIRERAELLLASPLLDVRNAFRATPGAEKAMASGLRLAVLLQRTLDWSGATPVLAHMLYGLAGGYASLGDARRAASTLREALKEYGRFPGTFPGDHPRVLAARAALAACSAACSRSPPPPPPPLRLPASSLSPPRSLPIAPGSSSGASPASLPAPSPARLPPSPPRPPPLSSTFASLDLVKYYS